MQRPTLLLRDLCARHTSADSALRDPVFQAKDTPKCLGEAIRLLRDTPYKEIEQDIYHEIRGEPRILDAVARKFKRYEPAGNPIGSWDLNGVHTLLRNTAEQYALAPNLQPAYTANYTSHTIVGIHWPWYGNADFLSITGDGLGLLKFKVLATDPGGPTHFQMLNRDDPDLNAFAHQHYVSLTRCLSGSNPVINGPHYQQRFNDRMAEMNLLGDINIEQFEAVLREVFRPPSYWHSQEVSYTQSGAECL